MAKRQFIWCLDIPFLKSYKSLKGGTVDWRMAVAEFTSVGNRGFGQHGVVD